MKIAVLLRVYNRIEDLKICVELIRKNWIIHDYYVIIVTNGVNDGFIISDETAKKADFVYTLDDNVGHFSGNSQLLISGINIIPSDCDYTIILEADTWLFSDKIISKYITLLQNKPAVWASAEWLDKYYSLAVDFAIINTSYLKKNPLIFKFQKNAESVVYNYLHHDHQSIIYIKEAMPVHFPKLLRYFYNPSLGRMRCFSQVPMITHHIEDLKEGIEEKKAYGNVTAGYNIFSNINIKVFTRKFLKFIEFLIVITPRSTWVQKKKLRKIKL